MERSDNLERRGGEGSGDGGERWRAEGEWEVEGGSWLKIRLQHKVRFKREISDY